MILNHAKLARGVTFMKNSASTVALIFLPKTLISDKTAFKRVSPRIQSECEKIRTRKTPNTDTFHAELVANELKKTISKNIYQHSFFHPVIQ